MKILYLLHQFPNINSEAFILNELAELQKLGNDVWILADKPNNLTAQDLHALIIENNFMAKIISNDFYPRGINKLASFVKKIVPNFISNPKKTFKKFYFIFLHNHYYKSKNFWTKLDNYLVLEKILPKNFDIIYAPFAHLEKIDRGLSIAQIIGAPFATAFRALDLHSYNCRQDIITYQKLFSKIAGLVTISKFNQEKLLDLLGPEAKINIIHSAIDPEKFIPTPRINNQPPKIITISRFVEKKGIPYLLEALSVLKKDGVNVDYTLIGDGPLKSDYESLIEKFNLKDTVKILPSVKQESIKLFLQQSDMMVLPCIIDRNGDRDIMANVLKEAMSMELPVITSNISGIEELIVNQKNGLLVPEKDVPALAEAIKKLINNSELRKEMGIAGRQKIITDFNIHQEAAKLNQFFLEIKKNNH